MKINLGAICIGLTMGWPSSSIESDTYGQNKSYGFVDSIDLQIAMNIGASLGAFLPTLIADIYGRRFCFLCSGITCSIFWTCVACTLNKTLVLFAASLAGFGVGIYVTTSILYVGEISSHKNRGIVGTFTSFFANFGILIICLAALFINLRTLAFIVMVMTLTFIFSIYLFMVESPYFLFQRGKVLDAKISLKNLRDTRTVLEVEDDYRSIENFFNSEHQRRKKPTRVFKEVFFPRSTRKSVIIILPFLCLSQMMGSYAMNHYLENVLRHFVPRFEYPILSSVNAFSAGFCIIAIEKIGRKTLLIISIVGSATCCLLLAIYKLIQRQDCQNLMKGELIIPMMLILAYYIVYLFGLIPLLPILAGEIFPNRIKTAASGICVSLVYVAALSVQSIFEFLNTRTNSCLAFGSFAILGSIGLPLIVTFLPETKGKSLYEIQSELDTISIVLP